MKNKQGKRTTFSVVCTLETLLKRAKKANIALFSVEKRGARIQFSVDDDNAKKVFAIFDKACYNIVIVRKSQKSALLQFFKRRVGVVVGVLLFACARVFADFSVLRIDVVGTGAYLKEQIKYILACNQIKIFGWQKDFDYAVARSQIMALPQVTFCDVEKRGPTLIVNVQTDEEHSAITKRGDLLSDREGTVVKIVATCGTPLKQQGEKVKRGESLIGAYYLNAEGEKTSCLAVGYAVIECSAVADFYASEQNETNDEFAKKLPLIYSESATQIKFLTKKEKDGVVYEVSFTYERTIKINLE